jgi:ferredoxin
MAKEISFSEFLKEGALKEDRHPAQEEVIDKPKPFRIEPEEVASDADVRAFWKELRKYFRTGERPGEKNGIFVPALIGPYLQDGRWDTEYPFYLGEDSDEGCSIEQLITDKLEAIFDEGEAKILSQNIMRIVAFYRESVSDDTGSEDFAFATKAVFERMSAIEVRGDEGERFQAQLKQLMEALPESGHVLKFHHEVPLHFVRQNLSRIERRRKAYKDKIKNRIEELDELLNLDSEKKATKEAPQKGFEFADDLIELDKVQKMSPKSGSSKLSEDRLNRILKIRDLLRETLEGSENRAHLIVSEELKEGFRWEELFPNSKISYDDMKPAFAKADKIFEANIDSFTQVLIAMRKAELELKGNYENDVHDDYFDHFKWFKLSGEELELFPPVILITGAAHLLQDAMNAFSNFLVSNKPIKLLALTNRTTHEVNPEIDWEDASHSFRQELAAIAMSHRGAHTLQCASDHARSLLTGISASFESITPSVMHVLIPHMEEDKEISFLKINAAAAGRYFPYLEYDVRKGSQWGSRFDISDNSQEHKDWPEYPFLYTDVSGHEVEGSLHFTYADYKAMTSEKVEELFLIPENMVTDYLIPIHNYLQMDQDEVTGKVPYIWLIDEDNRMVRAALPYMWVVSCQERLDFWNFLQEVGGVNSFHVKAALETARMAWEEEKQAEIEVLKAEQRMELDALERSAASQSMEKLVNVLLNLDDVEVKNSPAKPNVPKKAPAKAEKPAVEKKEVKKEKPAAKKKEEVGGTEAWLETFKCTSCNDCTEKFPAIFEYNEDKQAFIKDVKGGTFEQLVVAAEGCPAACIHPGDPMDPKEANLDELKSRAAKFN